MADFWEDRFNEKTKSRLTLSVIGEMMAYVAREKAMSLTAGEPFEELYPADALREAFGKALQEDPSIYAYSNERSGIPELREWISTWMHSDGLAPSRVTGDNVFITSGSQEGLHFLAECFVEPGTTVLVESPSYPEALIAFRKEGARFVDVPLGPDGPDIEVLESILAQERISFFYTIPTYQNPTGYVTCDAKKRAVLDLARKYGFFILEDDPYRHLSYAGPPGSTYLSLAEGDDLVLYMGSFSKIVAPGMRIGWVVAPLEVIKALLKLRVVSNLCLPVFNQLALMFFLKDLDLAAWLAKLRIAYRSHRDALAEGLRQEAGPQGLVFNIPEGGFFIWGRIPWIKDMHDFARFAVAEEKVGVLPGDIFFIDPLKGKDTLRLSFAKTPPHIAAEGCRRLGRALEAYRSRG